MSATAIQGVPAASTSSTESSGSPQSTESAQAIEDTTPIALADRLDTLPEEPPARSSEVGHTLQGPAFPADAVIADAGQPVHRDPTTSYGVRAGYRARNSRVHALLVGVLFVAVAGAVYWIAMKPTLPGEQRATTGEAPTTVTERTSTAPTAPPPTASTPAESPTSPATVAAPAADAVATPSSPAESRAAVDEPKPAGAEATPPPAVQTPERVEAQMPAHAPTAKPPAGKAARTDAGATGDARRRAAAQVRTREQAERDALATQRIIARDLADAPRADPRSPPAPGP